MSKFCRDAIDSSLTGLPFGRSMLFSLFVLDRMLPGLQRFSDENNIDISVFKIAEDELWNGVRNNHNAPMWKDLSGECIKLAPDSEVFSGMTATFALNCIISFSYMLDSDDATYVENSINVSSLSIDTIDSYLIYKYPKLTLSHSDENRILHSKIMQKEISTQRSNIEYVKLLDIDLINNNLSDIRRISKEQNPIIIL